MDLTETAFVSQFLKRRLAMDGHFGSNIVFVDGLETCTVQLQRDESARGEERRGEKRREEKSRNNEPFPVSFLPLGEDRALVQAEAGGAQASSQWLSRELLGLLVSGF